MSRYIDVVTAAEIISEKMGVHIGDLVDVFAEIPTADVVPKSEVEELIREYESLAKTVNEASELIRKLRSKLKKSKTEVAREIFEEFENKILAEIDLCNGVLVEFEEADELFHRIKGEVSALCEIQDFIAECKNKYTEKKE